MKNILKVCLMLAVAIATVGCYDDFDTPAEQKIYADEDFADLQHVTILEVKQMYIEACGTLADHGSNGSWDDTKFLQIEDDIYIKGKVQSSDEEGNVYKSIYICDETGAIEVKLGTGNYLNYPVGHFDPETCTMPSTYVYVKLKDLYIGNYRMMLSIGGAPSSSYNKVGEHKFYANSNIENPTTIAEHVFLGEPTELSGEAGDILEITSDNMNDIYCHAGNYSGNEEKALSVLGRLVWLKDVTCVYGEVDGNIYPSWMDTNVRPVVSKYWYNWAFNAKHYPSAANLYGSVLFTMDGKLPTYMADKAGIYVVRTSGYARFAGKPIVRNGATGDVLGHLAIYGKYWANYATYQISINRFEDIMFAEEDFISSEEADTNYFDRTGYHMDGYDEDGNYSIDWDAYYTPSTEDSMDEGSLE